jgi:tRNA A-37 threonylcarbamoyl transferase component Bud32
MSFAQFFLEETLIKAEARSLIWSEPLPDGSRSVVKMYRRRGLLDPLRRLAVPYRAEREFGLLTRLRAAGIPCPEPISWTHGNERRHGRYEILVTREIPSTVPLASLLKRARSAVPDLAPLFQLARRMHDCGVVHGAFYPANILVTVPAGNSPRYHLIDLAHGCHFRHRVAGTRPAIYDVLDMLRAIERLMPLHECPRWLAGYGDGPDGTWRFLKMLDGHRLERPWRHIRRAETDMREAMDRIGRTTADTR